MATETEVRFLVKNLPSLDKIAPVPIVQAYLSTDPAHTVRVRQRGDEGFLTIKGLKVGASAPEFEYGIPPADLPVLLALCGEHVLTKDRYGVQGPDGWVWDLDVFTGRHAGLVIAELELPAEDVPYMKPDWVGPEITTDRRFSNASLVATDIVEIKNWLALYDRL